MFIDNLGIVRILYTSNYVKFIYNPHKSNIIIHSDELDKYLLSLNKKFDLICMDTYHGYKESSRDFKLVTSLLSDSGILISHDCYPMNKSVAGPVFIPGPWCGETYIAFTELAYKNPKWFYGVLNIDTGIGIISKKPLKHLTNKLDKNKQKQLLFLHNTSNNPYDYFIKHAKYIINAIPN